MNWTIVRLLTYLAGFAASGFAFYGLADFDPVTGAFDLRPINVYELAAVVPGLVSSGLAALAVWRGWGVK